MCFYISLINAYRTSAKEALNNARIIDKHVSDYFSLSYEYDITGDIMTFLNRIGATIDSQGFENNKPEIKFHLRQRDTASIEQEFKKYNTVELKHIRTI